VCVGVLFGFDFGIPFFEGIGGPSFCFICVAIDAGVGCVVLYGEVWSGYSYAVVSAWVDDHVCFLWHMAIDAGCSFAEGFMFVVFGCVVCLLCVALCA